MILLVNQLTRFPHRLIGLVATTPCMTSSRRTAMPRHFCFPSRCLEWRTKPRDSRLRVSMSCTPVCLEKTFSETHFLPCLFVFLYRMFSKARDTNSTSNDQLTKSHVQGTVPEITNQHSQHAWISQITDIIDQNQETTSSWRRTPRNLGVTWSTWSSLKRSRKKRYLKAVCSPNTMKVASLQSYQLSFDWLFEQEICRIFVFGCGIGCKERQSKE